MPESISTWEEEAKEEQEVTAGRSVWTAATVAAGVRISWEKKSLLVKLEMWQTSHTVLKWQRKSMTKELWV